MNIKKLQGYQVLDSRGRPTVAVTITLSDGSQHTARVPSGASTGAHEARELRDAGTPKAESFYAGKSVFTAVENINTKIAPKLLGHSLNLAAIDGLLVERYKLGKNEYWSPNMNIESKDKTSFGEYFDNQRDRIVKAMQDKNKQLNVEWMERYEKRKKIADYMERTSIAPVKIKK